MKRTVLQLVCLGLISGAVCLAQPSALPQAERLELQGQFKEAGAALRRALNQSTTTSEQRKRLEFELDRLERIKKDFPFTKETLYDSLKKSVKNLTHKEYEQWVAEGRFDSREIDGERYFMSSSVSNLFFRYPELAARRLPPKNTAALDKRHWETCVAIKNSALVEQTPYVLPMRFEVNMRLTAIANAAPDGQTVRAWLPIPREYPFQADFELLSATPEAKQVSPKDSPIRAVFMEQAAKKDRRTDFRIRYEYTARGVSFDLKPEKVKPADPNDPALAPFIREAPHIVFTPELRALSSQIAGQETNPCVKAKKFYDWIAGHIQYSYAI